MCGKKRERRSKEQTFWWNEEIEAVSRRKMHRRQRIGIVLSRTRNKKNDARKAVSKTMRENAIMALTDSKIVQIGCLDYQKKQIDGKEAIEG